MQMKRILPNWAEPSSHLTTKGRKVQTLTALKHNRAEGEGNRKVASKSLPVARTTL
jgi:hypothetical protein